MKKKLIINSRPFRHDESTKHYFCEKCVEEDITINISPFMDRIDSCALIKNENDFDEIWKEMMSNRSQQLTESSMASVLITLRIETRS